MLLLDNHAVDPAHTVYIDDLKPNVEAAVALGMLASCLPMLLRSPRTAEGWPDSGITLVLVIRVRWIGGSAKNVATAVSAHPAYSQIELTISKHGRHHQE